MITVYNSKDLCEKKVKIVKAIESGQEIKLSIETLYEIGLAINRKHKFVNIDFFKAAQVMITYYFSQWINFKKLVLKISLKPNVLIKVYIPMTNNNREYVHIFQNKEKQIVCLLKDDKKTIMTTSPLVELFETKETMTF